MGIIRATPLNNLRRLKITHALRIPVATSSSRAQLQKFLKSLRDSNLTRAIPHTAWSTVDSLYLHFGVLSLTSQSHITAARDILERFDIALILGEASPFRVSLRGLHSGAPGEQREYTHRLYAHAEFADYRQWMTMLRLTNELRTAFKAEKLLAATRDGLVPSVKLMTTRNLFSDEPKLKSTMADFKFSKQPQFHATDTYAAYSDTVWAKDFALERICVSEQCLSDIIKGGTVIGEGYRDVACVPFPGFPGRACESQDSGLSYVKAARLHPKNRIRTSFMIPSNSQPVAPKENTGLDEL